MFSGRHREARRRLQRAIDLDPNCAFAHAYIGVSHAFAGERDVVLRHCDEAMQLSPRDPLAILYHLPKGWAALNAERYEEAIEFATRAAEANPEFPDVYAVRAAAEGQLGMADAARSTLEELLRRMPGLTVADERLNRPFARAADLERFLTGLRKAGLPDG
jgi:tetratricopeptide (TPR) repeat protein